MRIRIEGRELPQTPELRLNNVHVGVQRRAEVVGRVPVTAGSAVWEMDVEVREVDGLIDVGGPWVHGSPGARFLYLSWGAVHDGEFAMFRRAKLLFGDVPGALLRGAVAGEGVLVGRLGLTDSAGDPLCARVRPPVIAWTLSPFS
ncbi:hypothetical protein ACWT_2660 [Actinoplanes sp. SE50]|uniref:DUF5990 family protein n=1 Tax=unclassified Actinoplanes TaxID=2626549 RepID=UPI00023ECC91|nr:MULTISPECIES: DUF5990 family protein [unclassified Actinoplanes]AEV83781.1 hypothetical protein ACPL_2886 [Actinoplanes sp. SE50/110]ATO82075.1 hypothetical protein ACWT_2660 [Actinoplanes sp. SE50]SLL99483.1 hypothetical protein ACSP50_2714 [Actinoplanes sp. SE50/110]